MRMGMERDIMKAARALTVLGALSLSGNAAADEVHVLSDGTRVQVSSVTGEIPSFPMGSNPSVHAYGPNPDLIVSGGHFYDRITGENVTPEEWDGLMSRGEFGEFHPATYLGLHNKSESANGLLVDGSGTGIGAGRDGYFQSISGFWDTPMTSYALAGDERVIIFDENRDLSYVPVNDIDTFIAAVDSFYASLEAGAPIESLTYPDLLDRIFYAGPAEDVLEYSTGYMVPDVSGVPGEIDTRIYALSPFSVVHDLTGDDIVRVSDEATEAVLSNDWAHCVLEGGDIEDADFYTSDGYVIELGDNEDGNPQFEMHRLVSHGGSSNRTYVDCHQLWTFGPEEVIPPTPTTVVFRIIEDYDPNFPAGNVPEPFEQPLVGSARIQDVATGETVDFESVAEITPETIGVEVPANFDMVNVASTIDGVACSSGLVNLEPETTNIIDIRCAVPFPPNIELQGNVPEEVNGVNIAGENCPIVDGVYKCMVPASYVDRTLEFETTCIPGSTDTVLGRINVSIPPSEAYVDDESDSVTLDIDEVDVETACEDYVTWQVGDVSLFVEESEDGGLVIVEGVESVQHPVGGVDVYLARCGVDDHTAQNCVTLAYSETNEIGHFGWRALTEASCTDQNIYPIGLDSTENLSFCQGYDPDLARGGSDTEFFIALLGDPDVDPMMGEIDGVTPYVSGIFGANGFTQNGSDASQKSMFHVVGPSVPGMITLVATIPPNPDVCDGTECGDECILDEDMCDDNTCPPCDDPEEDTGYADTGSGSDTGYADTGSGSDTGYADTGSGSDTGYADTKWFRYWLCRYRK